MSFIIKSITIYNFKGEKRTLELNNSGLTIITGSSGTGKTSIADIITYCLGGDFDVKGKIRDVIEWYSLHIKINDNEVFIARKTPPNSQASTNTCHFVVGKELQVPDYKSLLGKDNIESATSFISRAMGISSNSLHPKPGSTLSPAEPSLKHSLYYNFLKQSTIANEKVLFHKQEDQFVSNYIKLTAPYFIGAIPEDQIAKKIELAELKRKLRQIILEIQDAESIAGKGTLRGMSLLKEAESLDIVDVTEEPQSINKVLDLLRQVKWEKLESLEKMPSDLLSSLHLERENLTSTYNNLRGELEIATKFQKEQGAFSHESNEQSGRLQSIQLFKVFDGKEVECPSCGRHGVDFTDVSSDISRSFKKLNNQIEQVSNNRTKLGKYIEDLRAKIAEVKSNLQIVNSNIFSVTRQNNDLMKQKDIDQQKAKVFGRISLYLESIEGKKDLSGLAEKRKELEIEVAAIEAELSLSTAEDVLEAQLSFINKEMTTWSKDLKMEYAGFDYRLNLNKLTVEAMTEKGPISMSKMGSGQNWLGCHLITYFSLQKWFISKSRPVPSFLFLDQPSQVWFPPDSTDGSKITNEDWTAVKRLYDWLYRTVNEIPGLQVILVDHVDFKNDANFSAKVKEVWRNGEALVPYSWMK